MAMYATCFPATGEPDLNQSAGGPSCPLSAAACPVDMSAHQGKYRWKRQRKPPSKASLLSWSSHSSPATALPPRSPSEASLWSSALPAIGPTSVVDRSCRVASSILSPASLSSSPCPQRFLSTLALREVLEQVLAGLHLVRAYQHSALGRFVVHFKYRSVRAWPVLS